MMLHHHFLSSTRCLLFLFCVVEGQPDLKLKNCQPNDNPNSEGKHCDAEKGEFELSGQPSIEVEFEDGHKAVFYKKTIRADGWYWLTETGQSFSLVKVKSQEFGVFDYGGIIYDFYQDDINGNYHVWTIPKYEFPPEADGPRHSDLVVQLDESNLIQNPVVEKVNIRNLDAHNGSQQANQLRGLRGDSQRQLGPGDTVLDVLIVWTKKAECGESNFPASCTMDAGTETMMRGRIATAISRANTAYENSGIDIELRLVHAYRDENYEEDPDDPSGVGLDHLGFEGDGYLDGVYNKRDSSGADIVALIYDRDGASTCGQANIGDSDDPDAGDMFSVTSFDCIDGDTFSHELGHNFGE
jgi:hypothetical protein